MEDTQFVKPWRRPIICIHCDRKMWATIQVDLGQLESDEGQEENTIEKWRESLEPDQQRFLREAEATGMIKGFSEAVHAAKGPQMPNNIERFLLTFFATGVRKLVPSSVLNFYIASFPNSTITFFGAQGVVAVIADGIIKCFVPSDYAVGAQVRKGNGNGSAVRTDVRMDELENWRRTRMGYVLHGDMFGDELKKIAIGSFAHPRIEIANRR